MTAADIAARYLGGDQTPERLLKARAVAQANKIAWKDVQQQIEAA